jgi:hypothetical protein
MSDPKSIDTEMLCVAFTYKFQVCTSTHLIMDRVVRHMQCGCDKMNIVVLTDNLLFQIAVEHYVHILYPELQIGYKMLRIRTDIHLRTQIKCGFYRTHNYGTTFFFGGVYRVTKFYRNLTKNIESKANISFIT